MTYPRLSIPEVEPVSRAGRQCPQHCTPQCRGTMRQSIGVLALLSGRPRLSQSQTERHLSQRPHQSTLWENRSGWEPRSARQGHCPLQDRGQGREADGHRWRLVDGCMQPAKRFTICSNPASCTPQHSTQDPGCGGHIRWLTLAASAMGVHSGMVCHIEWVTRRARRSAVRLAVEQACQGFCALHIAAPLC